MTHTIIMWTYNLMTLFIVVVLCYNLFRCKSYWEQAIAIFVIVPFVLRVLMIK